MNFGVDHPRAAVVAIDLHRGHLDMAVATMPTTPEVATRIIAANKRLFDWCRSVDIPVVHQVTSYRDADEIRANPFLAHPRRGPGRHPQERDASQHYRWSRLHGDTAAAGSA